MYWRLFNLNLAAAGDNSANAALYPVWPYRALQHSLSPRANIQRDLADHLQVSSTYYSPVQN